MLIALLFLNRHTQKQVKRHTVQHCPVKMRFVMLKMLTIQLKNTGKTMPESQPTTLKKCVNLVRKIIALRLAMAVVDIAPQDAKPAFAYGFSQALDKLSAQDEQQVAKKETLTTPDFMPSVTSKDKDYYPERVWNICLELNLNPNKVVDSHDEVVCALIQAFSRGKIDEVQLMRTLRNLSVLNGGAWELVP
jgi:hypothetical protein